MAMMLAPLATPEKLLLVPATIPATCVPCVQSLAWKVQGAAEPVPVCVVPPLGHVELLA